MRKSTTRRTPPRQDTLEGESIGEADWWGVDRRGEAASHQGGGWTSAAISHRRRGLCCTLPAARCRWLTANTYLTGTMR